ncbi:MAG TPA: vWA domain-containing protein [Methylomirabilota bacterium]|nr:vWA domain-containing protein [Methylomirabilota bacterium]
MAGWLVALLTWGAGVVHAARRGVAVAIVYDNSGSMKQPVRTRDGREEPKYLIANRALLNVVRRLEAHDKTVAASSRTIHAGLYVFEGTGAKEVVPLGPARTEAIRQWVKNYPGPGAGTPLGAALEAAGRALLASPMSEKHVLVITDGANTVGPDPAKVLPGLQKQAAAGDAAVLVHFVAFDIDAKVFAPLKKLGVTVVGAADEAQLDQKLGFILEEKILLEKETR